MTTELNNKNNEIVENEDDKRRVVGNVVPYEEVDIEELFENQISEIKTLLYHQNNKKVLKLQGDHIDNIQNFLMSINITNFTTRDFKSI